jgi:hypothetical protein
MSTSCQALVEQIDGIERPCDAMIYAFCPLCDMPLCDRHFATHADFCLERIDEQR